MSTIGKLYALVVAASGDDGPETELANALLGAVPMSDVSDPNYGGGLAPLDVTKRAESAAQIKPSK